MIRRSIPLFFVFTILLAACGGSFFKSPTQIEVGDLAKGQEQFVLRCGGCHGADGTGTDLAPDVRGHTIDQVRAQVRSPEGEMAAIPIDKLSDADLAMITDYITSLEGEEEHPDIQPSSEERIHLEAAFEAIEDINNLDRQTAIEHLELAASLASDDAAEFYLEMLDSVKSSKAGNARHELKELLEMDAGHE